MSNLQTLPKYRRQGLAQHCVKSLSGHIRREFGLMPFVYIEVDNMASINLFEKMGFTRRHDASWLLWTPQAKGEKTAAFTKQSCCH